MGASDETTFVRELEILIKLSHPCILRILGFALPLGNEAAEIHMEDPPCRSLASILSRLKKMDSALDFWNPTGIGLIICGIALGMRCVHCNGFIHRDLKPSNILLSDRGHALIADFGTARPRNYDATLTPDTGTVYYAAPEMYKEDEHFSGKVDVFSFGSIVYEILTGCPVFPPSMMPFPILRKILKGDMPEIPLTLAPVMRNVIQRCWLNPESRPSFDDILNEIERSNYAIVPDANPVAVRGFCVSVQAWEGFKQVSDA
jgi:serine/threonine protein kinase